MDIKQAQKIINDYGKTCVKSAYMVLGAPISMLLYSKDEIKEAIKMRIIFSKPDESTSELIWGYTNLATYIDDQKACISILAVNAMKECAEGKDTPKNRETVNEAMKILEEIIHEHEKLLKELEPTLDYFFKNNKR